MVIAPPAHIFAKGLETAPCYPYATLPGGFIVMNGRFLAEVARLAAAYISHG